MLKDSKTLRKTLQAIQGRFLRTITGAYRATATEALEIETYIEPLDLYIERNTNLGYTRQSIQGQEEKIKTLRQRLARRTRGKRGRKRQISTLHYEKSIQNQRQKGIYLPKRLNAEDFDTSKEWKRYKKALEAYYAIKWRKRWVLGKKGRTIARYRPCPMRKALEIYKESVTNSLSTALRGTLEDDQPPLTALRGTLEDDQPPLRSPSHTGGRKDGHTGIRRSQGP